MAISNDICEALNKFDDEYESSNEASQKELRIVSILIMPCIPFII